MTLDTLSRHFVLIILLKKTYIERTLLKYDQTLQTFPCPDQLAGE